MPPTDFSFVKPEGWEMLKPDFERAESKWDKKVESGDLSKAMAAKLKKLMWDKYDRWSKGEGKKVKENQTLLQGHEKKASMEKSARTSKNELLRMLNLVADGTIDSKVVFMDLLKENRVEEDEFFSTWTRDVRERTELYPTWVIKSFAEKFDDWGYGEEMAKVVKSRKEAEKPSLLAPPKTEQEKPSWGENMPPIKEQPEPGGAAAVVPSPAAPPAPAPAPAAPTPRTTPAPAAPAEGRGPTVEPSPLPKGIPAPPPSKTGPVTRWYVKYTAKGDPTERATVVDWLNQEDARAFGKSMLQAGYKVIRIDPIGPPQREPFDPGQGAKVPTEQAPQSAAPAKQAPRPAAPAATGGAIESYDVSDPTPYKWEIGYRKGPTTGAGLVKVFTGAEVERMIQRMEQGGMTVTELKKLSGASITCVTKTAQDEGGYDEKFRNGTPIIFTQDVNLEFDALHARGQIKKNMTGKVKKVEDESYLIDIAGQFYRVPKNVADQVMDVFVANVVVDEGEAEVSGTGEAGEQPEAPQPTEEDRGGSSSDVRPVWLSQDQEAAASAFGRIVVAEFEIEAALLSNRQVAAAFAKGVTSGRSKNMIIKGDTIYSYGDHFPIATWIAYAHPLKVNFTTQSYSVTTSIHKSLVRGALAREGVEIVESSAVVNGKVGAPTDEDRAKKPKRERKEQPKQERTQKDPIPGMGPLEPTGPSGSKPEVEVKELPGPQPLSKVEPRKYTVLEDVPGLSKGQWQSRIEDVEDMFHRETDPEKKKRLLERLERMKQASVEGKIVVGSTYEERWGGAFVEVVEDILSSRYRLKDIEVVWGGEAIADPNFEEDGAKDVELPVHQRLPDGEAGEQIGTVIFDLVYNESLAEQVEAPYDVKRVRFQRWKPGQVEETKRRNEIQETRPDFGDITGMSADKIVVSDAWQASDYGFAPVKERPPRYTPKPLKPGAEPDPMLSTLPKAPAFEVPASVGPIQRDTLVKFYNIFSKHSSAESMQNAMANGFFEGMISAGEQKAAMQSPEVMAWLPKLWFKLKDKPVRRGSDACWARVAAMVGATETPEAPITSPADKPGQLTMGDISGIIEKQYREKFKLDKGEVKKDVVEQESIQRSSASKQTTGFGELLMMIEKEAPGVPSEIGRRLYKADGVIP